jgi:hypothetical protein
MTSDERRVVKVFKARYQQEGYEFPTWAHGDVELVGHYLVAPAQGTSASLKCGTRWTRCTRQARVHQYVVLAEDVRSSGLALMEQLAEACRASAVRSSSRRCRGTPRRTRAAGSTRRKCSGSWPMRPRRGRPGDSRQPYRGDQLPAIIPWQSQQPVLDAVRAVSLTHDIGKDIVSPDPGPMPEYTGDTPEEKRAWKAERRNGTRTKRSGLCGTAECRKRTGKRKSWFVFNDLVCVLRGLPGPGLLTSRGHIPSRHGFGEGPDSVRGGKALDTPEAVWWFKAHGASKFGLDKISFENRVRWVDEQHETLLAMAADPVGNRTWTEADSPVQFLAWALRVRGGR